MYYFRIWSSALKLSPLLLIPIFSVLEIVLEYFPSSSCSFSYISSVIWNGWTLQYSDLTVNSFTRRFSSDSSAQDNSLPSCPTFLIWSLQINFQRWFSSWQVANYTCLLFLKGHISELKKMLLLAIWGFSIT